MQSNKPLIGIGWMVLTGLNFVMVNVLVKYLGGEIPAVQSAFLRFALGLVLILPMLRPMLRAHYTKRIWRLIALRGAAHTIAVGLWFYAMTRIEMAQVTALNFLNPVYVTIGAALVLGETLRIRRILSVIAAFVGVLIILRPGVQTLDAGHYAMLGCSVFFAVGYLTAKILSRDLSAAVVVGMMSVSVTIGLAPFAIAVWVPPTLTQYIGLFCVAGFATAGHYTMTLAFKAAPVSVTQPVIFLQLVWAVALGALLFDEPVDIWVLVGGGLIIASVSYIAWRETVIRKQGRADT